MSHGELTSQIETLLKTRGRVVVAISGFGGAGKSTLAERLREQFGASHDQVVRLDHLYADKWDGPGIRDQVNWELLKEILEEVQSGGEAPLQRVSRRGDSRR